MNPEFSISVVDSEQINELFALAKALPGKRASLTLPRDPSEKTERVVKWILPEAYIRPSKHINPSQTETLYPGRGIAELVTFSDEGEITQMVLLKEGIVAWVDVNTFYTVVALSPFVTLEVKVHPAGYNKEKDEVFAPWAPEEGTNEADIYFENLREKLGLSEAS